MRRRSKTGGEPIKARHRKAVTPKRTNAPKNARGRSSPVGGGETDAVKLARELQDALEQQKATAEVLRLISLSPGKLEPVFEAILENATRICEAKFATLYFFDGNAFSWAAQVGAPPEYAEFLRQRGSFSPIHGTVLDHVTRTKAPVHIADDAASANPTAPTRLAGARSVLCVPMIKEDMLLGAIVIYRQEPRSFGDKQIELVQNFAAQAVIAIENGRLFDQLQQRTNDLSEALTYQTGSANILKVIASSPTDVEPVLKAIVESACELCGADDAVVHLREGDELRSCAHHGPIPVGMERRPINRNFASGRAAIDKAAIHVRDVLSAEGDDLPEAQEMSRRVGIRTVLCVPLLRENESIGTILLRRTEVAPFSDKQIALLQTFADQAVIAIENVRLFDEVQARTEDLREALQFQTATSDVLKVISRSPDALQPVLDAIVETSRVLCGSDASTIFSLREGKFHVTAVSGIAPTHLEFLQNNPPSLDQRDSVLPRVAREKRTLHYSNIFDDPELRQGYSGVGGPRALLTVPLMNNSEVIGAIVLRQSHLKPFSQRQIELVETFADQAVIAISNVNLFEQVQEATEELSQSLHDLRTAQDRLVQTEKLASLGQLTAGIAHEIKNPLNFVNNFSALSAELVGEMNDVLVKATLDERTRGELDELAQMLKSNLEKVVQHGKRADSIVKNMLLHSREGSGEQRAVDINAIVDESLNLAYHGARAEKAGFSMDFQRDLDPSAGMADVYPQEITRVLLNLISNGFYATTKRKAEAGDGFEPMLSASTKNLGDKVEIRIRDNGTGIPEEVKAKIFNPFFTTKPSGEGTGLGLSMSHDIIVKQHGGSIDVETEPGIFTEFKIVLPRTNQR